MASLAPAQLKDSQSFILLPNCIIETTMNSDMVILDHPELDHQEGEPNAMMLFDGESWRSVKLPE